MATKFTTERTGEILRVSPTIAAKWLERNTSNRPISDTYLRELAEAMTRGEWMENGESLKFDSNGVLLDGQHRLRAIILSGVTITTRVEFGLPSDAFITLDRGKKRNLGDALAMQGVSEYHAIAAAAQLLYKLHYKASTNRPASPLQLLEFYENHCAGVEASVSPTRHAAKMSPGSVVIAMHYLFAKHSRPLADEFMMLLGDGTNMGTGHPVLVLRERLIADKAAKASLPRMEIVILYIRAWNAFVTNRTLRSLRGSIGDTGVPDIVGPTWTGESE